jgi:Fe-S cluster assembly protein SufB
MNNDESDKLVREYVEGIYKYGFSTKIPTQIIEREVNEETIRLISHKKEESQWLLEFRLDAYRYWKSMTMPQWVHWDIPTIDYQHISYYAEPIKNSQETGDVSKVDLELVSMFKKLGIPLEEHKEFHGVAVDAVLDSKSVKTIYKDKLREKGIIFCSMGDAIRDYPDLVKLYLGTVVSSRDNYFAALNSAVFSDGSFVYMSKGVRCPMELSTYFRINAENMGQLKRGICKGEGSKLSWTQVETGSAITWKYPNCILAGDYSQVEFY